jgi:hypothetical protein
VVTQNSHPPSPDLFEITDDLERALVEFLLYGIVLETLQPLFGPVIYEQRWL